MTRGPLGWLGVAAGCLACSGVTPAATAASTRSPPSFDFAFVRGAPVAGTRLTACGRVTVTTTNTERFDLASFRKVASAEPATVTFMFDRPITAFDLVVSHVDAEHSLAGFNVGNPPKLSGALLQTADGKVIASAQGGQGTLTWTDLATQELSFALGGTANAGGAAVDRFVVGCRAP